MRRIVFARSFAWFGSTFAAVLLAASSAQAIPVLQLYIDGASYDSATETWVTTSASFDLWVIGNVRGPGGTRDRGIFDVRLSAAFETGATGSITLTPTTTGTVTDPSTPIAPTFLGVSADGARPFLSDGSALPSHGIYGAGVSFFEWQLGDFTLSDSPIGDFIDAFPGVLVEDRAQINVYHVDFTGAAFPLHFDTYDTVEGATHATFGPFSHDAGTVPEPGAEVLFGVGCLVVGVASRSRRDVGRTRALRA